MDPFLMRGAGLWPWCAKCQAPVREVVDGPPVKLLTGGYLRVYFVKCHGSTQRMELEPEDSARLQQAVMDPAATIEPPIVFGELDAAPAAATAESKAKTPLQALDELAVAFLQPGDYVWAAHNEYGYLIACETTPAETKPPRPALEEPQAPRDIEMP